MSKKIKLDESNIRMRLRDSVFKAMYPSPTSSYNPNKWRQHTELDISWRTTSFEQDIDNLLKIPYPEVLPKFNFTTTRIEISNSRRQSAECSRGKSLANVINVEQVPSSKKHRKTWNNPMEHIHEEIHEQSKQKIQLSDIICEFPIQERQTESQEPCQTPKEQLAFMDEIIERYRKYTDKKKQTKQSEQKQITFTDAVEECPNYIQEQHLEEQKQEEVELQGKTQMKKTKLPKEPKKSKQSKEPKKPKKEKKPIKQRVQDVQPEVVVIEEKTKVIRPPPPIEWVPTIPKGWKLLRCRKQAKKLAKYQSEQFEQLFKYIPGFYVAEQEGVLECNKLPSDHRKSFALPFVLEILPRTVIGPVIMKQYHIIAYLSKQSKSDLVYVDPKMEKKFEQNKPLQLKNKLIVINSSDQTIKLNCIITDRQLE